LADATIIGGGLAAQASSEVLNRAGFALRHAFDLDPRDRSPVILGELQGGFSLAKQAVEMGRHVLICQSQALGLERMAQLLELRKNSQAVFFWNERSYHPGYRFVTGLVEADSNWRPRYLRLETLSPEPTNSALARWRTLESLRLVMSVAQEAPLSISATSAENAQRNAPDLITLLIGFKELEAFVQVGLGEAIERREMLIAAPKRRAFIDELNSSAPVRLVDFDASARGGGSRWLASGSPGNDEMARQQCLAFFEATTKSNLAQAEANAWKRSLSSLEGMDRSLEANGSAVHITSREEAVRFRLLSERLLHVAPRPPTGVA
jgi:hypothetical protein